MAAAPVVKGTAERGSTQQQQQQRQLLLQQQQSTAVQFFIGDDDDDDDEVWEDEVVAFLKHCDDDRKGSVRVGVHDLHTRRHQGGWEATSASGCCECWPSVPSGPRASIGPNGYGAISHRNFPVNLHDDDDRKGSVRVGSCFHDLHTKRHEEGGRR